MERILEEIGLSKNEAKVYLALLRAGELSASALAEKTGIYRPHVYDKLNTLMEKGLVGSVTKANKKFFSAAQPKRLFDFLEERKKGISDSEKKLKSLLPELEKSAKKIEYGVKVDVLRGPEGFKTILRDAIELKADIRTIGVDERNYFTKELEIPMRKYFNARLKTGVREYCLVKEGDTFLPAPEEINEYRFIPAELFDPNTTIIYADRVVIIDWQKPMTCVRIVSDRIARSFLKRFNQLWRIAKKRKKKSKSKKKV